MPATLAHLVADGENVNTRVLRRECDHTRRGLAEDIQLRDFVLDGPCNGLGAANNRLAGGGVAAIGLPQFHCTDATA